MTAQNVAFWQGVARLETLTEAGQVTLVYSAASPLPQTTVLPSLLGAIWQNTALRGRIGLVQGPRRALEDSLKRVGMDPRQLQAFKQLAHVDLGAEEAQFEGLRYLLIESAEGLSPEQLSVLLSQKRLAVFIACSYDDSVITRMRHRCANTVECAMAEPPTKALHGRLAVSLTDRRQTRPVLFRASDSALFAAVQ